MHYFLIKRVVIIEAPHAQRLVDALLSTEYWYISQLICSDQKAIGIYLRFQSVIGSQTSRISFIWRNLVKMQILGLYPRHTDSEIGGDREGEEVTFFFFFFKQIFF